MTVERRQTACGMRHCFARRIVETGGRRKLVRTPTRSAERYPQGVCRIRKAAEPPTAAQQRMIGAEANRIAASNAATPRAGSSIGKHCSSSSCPLAMQTPFFWAGDARFLSRERKWGSHHAACMPQSTSHLCEKEEPSLERDSSFLFYSLRKRSAMTAAASAVDSAPVSR